MDTLTRLNKDGFDGLFNAEDIVIVSPLNWGLGHAARCIPIISHLQAVCRKVIIASDGAAMDLLHKEFPLLENYTLPSYGIKYRYKSILANVLLSVPSIIRAILGEYKQAHHLAKLTRATVILSDNRLCFRSSHIKNYYLTHQINLLHPLHIVAWTGSKIHQWFIRKFDICLVPDYEDDRSLCPKLSHFNSIKKIYLGPISRIQKRSINKIWDICVILSGPEPQRTILEVLLLNELKKLHQYKILFIRGVDEDKKTYKLPSNITFKNLLNSTEIEANLNTSNLLISRSGYTTLMDINVLDIKAILIPTPGQTEQEYLAKINCKSPKYIRLPQKEIKYLGKNIKSLI